MGKRKIDRIDVFTELVKPNETFDYEKCEALLGDHYNSFVEFCQAISIVPEEINNMKIVSFPSNPCDPVIFDIELSDGTHITLEK